MTRRIASALLTACIAVMPVRAGVMSAMEPAERAGRAERAVQREQELYDDGTEYLDDEEWSKAADKFRKVIDMKMSHADAALYWFAYAQNKMGERAAALASLVELQKTFPKSQWLSDAKQLEVEVRTSSGQSVAPENIPDEDVKLMAINGLMNSDPERAVPILEKILAGSSSPKLKERAIFVLSQSSSPRALEILGRMARDSAHPELQSKALKFLGIKGDDEARRILGDVYASTTDRKVKGSIMRSYMISGDSGRLLALAKTEQDPALRGDAVKQLGVMGAKNELAALYTTEKSVDVREDIINAMFISGSVEKLGEIARTEPVTELRLSAIRKIGLVGGVASARLLLSLYDSNPGNNEVRKAVVDGLFVSGNAKALIELARKEKDPAMKKSIVSKLAIMGSPEATEYMLELLKE